MFVHDYLAVKNLKGILELYIGGDLGKVILNRTSYFFPPNAFLRRRRKKALLRVNDRGGGWKMCILALRRVCVCVTLCVRARGHVCS